MEEVYKKFRDELLNSCVPFWLKNGVDKEYGGCCCIEEERRLTIKSIAVAIGGC